MPVELQQVVQALEAIGCPKEKCSEMAAQLIKRAGQLSQERNQSEEEALVYLLQLMRQGWAANRPSLDS